MPNLFSCSAWLRVTLRDRRAMLLNHQGDSPFFGGLVSSASLIILTGKDAKDSDKCHNKIHDIWAIATPVRIDATRRVRYQSMTKPNFYEQVYAVVRCIPRGQVTSYGRIAKMLGAPNAARAVGYALRALKDKQEDSNYDDIPWQRVVNSQGRISIVNREYGAKLQAEILREEGVEVSEDFQINLDRFLWPGLHWVELDDIING